MQRTRFPRRWHWFAGLFGSMALVPLIAGCGQRTAQVSGQVLYKDKPVPGGYVMFRPTAPGAVVVQTTIDGEGRYELTVPVGEAQIAVDNSELAPREKPPPLKLPPEAKLPPGIKVDAPRPDDGKKGGKLPASGKYVEIPETYQQFETSGLRYTVKPESQTHNIELK